MTHYQERLEQRITSATSLDVSYETGSHNYNKVGTTKVSDQFKSNIADTITRINNTDFGTRKDYAVKVAQFPLNAATVKFNTPADRIAAQGKMLVANVNTAQGESNGNEMYCIIRGGKITTFCFVKSYTSNQNGLAGKLRVDAVIKNLKNFKKNK